MVVLCWLFVTRLSQLSLSGSVSLQTPRWVLPLLFPSSLLRSSSAVLLLFIHKLANLFLRPGTVEVPSIFPGAVALLATQTLTHMHRHRFWAIG